MSKALDPYAHARPNSLLRTSGGELRTAARQRGGDVLKPGDP